MSEGKWYYRGYLLGEEQEYTFVFGDIDLPPVFGSPAIYVKSTETMVTLGDAPR